MKKKSKKKSMLPPIEPLSYPDEVYGLMRCQRNKPFAPHQMSLSEEGEVRAWNHITTACEGVRGNIDPAALNARELGPEWSEALTPNKPRRRRKS